MEFRESLLQYLYEKGLRYIARDGYPVALYAYYDKSSKSGDAWCGEPFRWERLDLFDELFPDIKWEDEEPFNIATHLDITDWAIVPVDTKVLVRDNDTEKWEKAYFKEYRADDPYVPFVTFGIGKTSWSASSSSDTGWAQCKLAEAEE